MTPALRHALQAGLLLGVAALLAVGVLVGVEHLTRERIAAAEHEARLRALAAVMPVDRYDNNPIDDVISVRARGWLGSDQALRVWRARRGDAPVQLVIETVAPRGYSGPISLLVGVDAESRIVGVRVTQHQETPGLGDAIERRRGPWIDGFAGRRLGDPPVGRWRVHSDGGDFDQFTGATITPRAVVSAVASSLAFVETHGPALYAAPPGETLVFEGGPPPLPRP